MPVGGTGDRLQEALGRVLRWATRSEVHGVLHGGVEQSLSATDAWLLDAVVRAGPVRVSDLASWQGVDRSTVTPQVRRLEDRGLIARRTDGRDRRVALLMATADGLELHADLRRQRTRVLDELLDHWPAAERETLAVLLTRFADDLAGGAATPPDRPR